MKPRDYERMTLGERQEHFSRCLMLLLLHIHAAGYSVRGGHWMRCRNCHTGARRSVHKEKLAVDLNLSLSPSQDERPRFLTGRAARLAHSKFHDYWDSLGGAKRINRDLNHYSLPYQGMR